jgi:hypothetical protein
MTCLPSRATPLVSKKPPAIFSQIHNLIDFTRDSALMAVPVYQFWPIL